MRNCAERTIVAAALIVACGALALAQAQSGPADAYEALRAREAAHRGELGARVPASRAAALAKGVRATIADYDAMSRTYRTSGYSDNALWQAALLATDLYRAFGDAADRRTAQRLLTDLAARFPSSSLVKSIPAQRARLEDAAAKVPSARTAPVPAPPAASGPRTPPAAVRPASTAGAAERATLTGIDRAVLGDTQRVTLTFDREVPFSGEQSERPARVAVDFPDTRIVYALKDARLTYPDGLVRGIRVVRPNQARMRVVVDLEDGARYSIYPMYDPFRLVLDVTRPRPKADPAKAASAQVAEAQARPAPAAVTPAAAGRVASARGGAAGSDREKSVDSRSDPRSGVSLSRQLGLRAARIVVDAGHGGHDPGALGQGLSEAELVLDVALRLEALLRSQPGIEVILTRRTDAYVALEERTALANKAGADLFISIHANASANANAEGVETYFLNFAPNAAAEAIAARENATSTKTMSNLTDIVRAIAMNDKVDESRAFAMRVQTALHTGLRKTNKTVKNLGVKQAPFQVLVGATMPSVLAEISFLTNAREGALLRTDQYRAQIAQALVDGILAYQRSLEPGRVLAAADSSPESR